jgi:hypothetical protein
MNAAVTAANLSVARGPSATACHQSTPCQHALLSELYVCPNIAKSFIYATIKGQLTAAASTCDSASLGITARVA